MEPSVNPQRELINQSLQRLQGLEKTMDSIKDVKMNSAYRGHTFTPQKRGLISYSLRGEWREKREQLRDVEKIYKDTLDDLSKLLIEGAKQENVLSTEELQKLKTYVDHLNDKVPDVKLGLEKLQKEFHDNPGIATKATKVVKFEKFIESLNNSISSETRKIKNLVDHVKIDDHGRIVLNLTQKNVVQPDPQQPIQPQAENLRKSTDRLKLVSQENPPIQPNVLPAEVPEPSDAVQVPQPSVIQTEGLKKSEPPPKQRENIATYHNIKFRGHPAFGNQPEYAEREVKGGKGKAADPSMKAATTNKFVSSGEALKLVQEAYAAYREASAALSAIPAKAPAPKAAPVPAMIGGMPPPPPPPPGAAKAGGAPPPPPPPPGQAKAGGPPPPPPPPGAAGKAPPPLPGATTKKAAFAKKQALLRADTGDIVKFAKAKSDFDSCRQALIELLLVDFEQGKEITDRELENAFEIYKQDVETIKSYIAQNAKPQRVEKNVVEAPLSPAVESEIKRISGELEKLKKMEQSINRDTTKLKSNQNDLDSAIKELNEATTRFEENPSSKVDQQKVIDLAAKHDQIKKETDEAKPKLEANIAQLERQRDLLMGTLTETLKSGASDLKSLEKDVKEHIRKLKSGEIEAPPLPAAPKRTGIRTNPKT